MKFNISVFARSSQVFFVTSIILILSGCYTINENNLDDQTLAASKDSKIEQYSNVELEIRTVLVKKFNPGQCFGMPSTGPFYGIKQILNDKLWCEYIKNTFEVKSNHDIYEKSQQLDGIKLIETNYGFDFRLVDGRCCTIITYKGTIYYQDGVIEKIDVSEVDRNKRPC